MIRGLRLASAGVEIPLAIPGVEDAQPEAPEARATVAGERRYEILDALRFVLAFWVAMAHFGVFPLFAGMDTARPLGRFVVHAWSSLVFGIPAVIVFFVISGFCIHWPFRHGERFSIGRYYARRYTRILVPVGAALWIYAGSGIEIHWLGEHSILWDSVLWSLACEEIYYAAYPLIILAKKRFRWRRVIPASFVMSVACSAPLWREADFRSFGPIVTALILFPVWLLGCVLAEQAESLPRVTSGRTILGWRLAAWGGSWICGILEFKGHIYWPQTLVWFGLLAYFWMKRELAHNVYRRPWRYLALGGAWSYSLYLIHIPAMRFYDQIGLPSFGYTMNWVLSFGFMLCFSFLFYRAIERPSHRMARGIRVYAAPKPETKMAVDTLATTDVPAAEGAGAAGSERRVRGVTAVAAAAGSSKAQTSH